MDVWLANRSSRQPRQGRGADRGVDRGADPCVANNVATRLLQVHLCVIYMFGGLAKVRGETWWDGSAMWRNDDRHQMEDENRRHHSPL